MRTTFTWQSRKGFIKTWSTPASFPPEWAIFCNQLNLTIFEGWEEYTNHSKEY